MFIDTHAHLDCINNLDSALKQAKRSGVLKIIAIGSSLKASYKSTEIAQKYSDNKLQIYATCGIHPKDGKTEIDRFSLLQCIKTLKLIAKSSSKVVGVGEAGLDYYSDTTEEEKEFQRELFKEQIKLADGLNLPIVIHCRNAWDDVFSLLSTDYGLGANLKGVFHSWTGDWHTAKGVLELGFYISFSGIVTFKNAKDIQEVAKKVPIEKILIETDSPFLSPEPSRGKTNEPKHVKIIAEFLASLRGQPVEEISVQTSKNAQDLFELS